MRYVVISDLHLDWETQGVRRFGEVARAISLACEKLIDPSTDALVCLGDVANPDSPTAWEAVSHLASVAWGLSQRGFRSFWLAGNHDVISGSPFTTISPIEWAGDLATVITTPRVIQFGDDRLMFLPFVDQSNHYDPAEFVVANGKGCRLSFSHLNIEGFVPGSETTDMARGRSVFLPTREVVALTKQGCQFVNGHYHRGGEFELKHESGTARILIPGSLARLTHGEEANSPSILEIET